MTEQEKFEAWVKNPHMLDKSTSPNDCGQYTHPRTIGAWKGWQAAIAIASREPMSQEQQGDLIHPDDDMATFIRTIASVERFHEIGE